MVFGKVGVGHDVVDRIQQGYASDQGTVTGDVVITECKC